MTNEENKEVVVEAVVKVTEPETCTINDFAKCKIKIGKILSCETIEGADKLYKFSVDLGEESGPRIILSGIREFYPDGQVLVGRQVPVLTNLIPRKIRGVESNGMILYAVGDEHSFLFTISPEKEVGNGTSVQ